MSVETLVAPDQEQAVDVERKMRLEPHWDVVVWNDPINLMSYVVLVLRKLFGHDQQTATKMMLQIHHEGRALVASQTREQAEISVAHLHGFGLHATLALP